MHNKILRYLKQTTIPPFDFSNCTVSFLAQGEYNQNYLVQTTHQKFVFRINIASQLGLINQIAYEYQALIRLQQSLRTPKVFYVDDSKSFFPHGILIMEFLEGNPLNYHTDLKQATDIFQAIHALPIHQDDYKYFITENHLFSDRIKEGKLLLDSVWDSSYISIEIKTIFQKLLQKLEKLSINEKYFIQDPWHVICNTEVNSHNFIIGENHAWLIDWEKPVISDPCQDITQFLAPTTTLWKQNTLLTKKETEFFFQQYETLFPNKNIRERVHLYTPFLYLRALSWCACAYIEYQDPNKTITNSSTYTKIKEYLEPSFLNILLKDIL